MSKYIKKTWMWAISIVTFIFMFVPEDSFKDYQLFTKLSENITIVINRLGIFVIVIVISFVVNGLILLFRNSVKLKGRNYTIIIKYGDIFKQKNSKKVIPFDECFTTTVGVAPYDINPNSICGQYLQANSNVDIQQLISIIGLKSKGKSKYGSKERYESGRVLMEREYLLMAFAKLDKEGLGRMTREEYLESLSVLWEEINKWYGQQDVCIPILGSGVTRIGDTSLTQQELLDIMISSYKLSLTKIHNPNKLYIICKRRDDFSLNKIEG